MPNVWGRPRSVHEVSISELAILVPRSASVSTLGIHYPRLQNPDIVHNVHDRVLEGVHKQLIHLPIMLIAAEDT